VFHHQCLDKINCIGSLTVATKTATGWVAHAQVRGASKQRRGRSSIACRRLSRATGRRLTQPAHHTTLADLWPQPASQLPDLARPRGLPHRRPLALRHLTLRRLVSWGAVLGVGRALLPRAPLPPLLMLPGAARCVAAQAGITPAQAGVMRAPARESGLRL